MNADSETLFYRAAGPLAAIVMGAALVPLRELTPASNLTFVFIAWTIVVAEVGGRTAGVLTAVVSALSLDFFLTKPYLRLSIEDKHDVVAFAGLAVCGLIASALASSHRQRIATLEPVREHRDLLSGTLRRWDPAAPLSPQLKQLLGDVGRHMPVSVAVVRDTDDRVLGCSDLKADCPVPRQVLDGEALFPGEIVQAGGPRMPLPLPAEGARVPLFAGRERVGWLDLWGDGRTASLETRRTLADLARIIGVQVWNERVPAAR